MSILNRTIAGSAAAEPIAIVGLACRLPGAPDPDAFWAVLVEGRETVGEYPAGRSRELDRVYSENLLHGTSEICRRGGFLPHLDYFDAQFFGISPREAALIDPHQRLLLELAWETLEDAGVPASKMAGTRTGVFAGIWTSDYEHSVFECSREPDFYATTGGGRYSASGRVAYFLDLRGPSLTVDTACSSSLVAIHLACQSLRNGESEMAFAGGANVILRPDITQAYSSAKMLSPDGRCKFGDASANGYVRSEGAALLLLKPLSRALADGDRIRAVVRGSAMNNDGRSSGLLISPSRSAQEALLKRAWEDAGISADDVDYIEAHGTGTAVGDPVEIGAIANVMAGRSRGRCAIGSVKTNIGHTESAAGAAGVVKVVLSLEGGYIPASLHVKTRAPAIDWEKSPVALQTSTQAWPAERETHIAGVSGFGITGTNAHVVLESFPASRQTPDTGRTQLLLLSGNTEEALESSVKRWHDRLGSDSAWAASMDDVAYAAAVGRDHHDFRLAVLAKDRTELERQLGVWLRNEEQTGIRMGRRRAVANHRLAFIFPGQGGQWAGMGRCLFHDEPLFRDSMAVCDALIAKHTGWSAIEKLVNREPMTDIDIVQPCLFAVMGALAALWRSWGIEPAAVVGHSMGEVAAAVAAGGLSLEDGAAVVCHRSRLMKRASGRGLMALAELSYDDAERLVANYNGRVSVAAANSSTSVVLSGDAELVDEIVTSLETRETFCRRIQVDVASHCAHMDPLCSELVAALRDIHPREGSIPMYSTVTGVIERGPKLDPEYWARNLRQTVRFSDALGKLMEDGFDTFIEINAHPVLLHSVEEEFRRAGKNLVAVGSMRRDHEERAELLGAIGALHVNGFPIDFRRIYPRGAGAHRPACSLPLYPWKRERHWIDDSRVRAGNSGVHPDLGVRTESSIEPGTELWEIQLKPFTSGIEFAAWFLEVAVAASSTMLGSERVILDDVEFESGPGESTGQLVFRAIEPGRWALRVSERTEAGWITRCSAEIRLATEEHDNPTDSHATTSFEMPPDKQSPIAFLLRQSAGKASGDQRLARIRRVEWTGVKPGVRLIGSVVAGQGKDGSCRIVTGENALVLNLEGVQFEIGSLIRSENVYDLVWRLQPALPAGRPEGLSVIICRPGGVGEKLAEALGTNKRDAICVERAEQIPEAIEVSGAPCRRIICESFAEGNDPEAAAVAAMAAVRAAQTAASIGGSPRLWLLTEGAWKVAESEIDISAAQGSIWGLARVIEREHPELRCSTIDVSPNAGPEAINVISALLRADTDEDQLAVRGDRHYAARYTMREAAPECDPPFSPEATYLITGGLGALGLEIADWMSRLGARHLALTSRRLPSIEAEQRIELIRSRRCEVRVVAADIANEAEVARVFDAIDQMPPLRGIFHLAVVTEGALVASLERKSINAVMRPKAVGAWTLHRRTEKSNLEFFVMFSSVAAAISQPGQGSYAAANGYLDSLARYRRSMGLPAMSIQWGPWTGLGLALQEGAIKSLRGYQNLGIRTLSVREALGELGRAMRVNTPNCLVLPVQWEEFVKSMGGAVPPIFSELFATYGVKNAPSASIRDRLVEAHSEKERGDLIERHVREELAAVLKNTAARIDRDKPLGSIGLDSLMALEFLRRLAASTGVRIPVTSIFNYPTLRLLSQEVATRMGFSQGTPAVESSRPTAPVPGVASLSELSEEDALEALIGGDGGGT